MGAGSSASTSSSTGGGGEHPQRNRSGTIIAVLSVVTAALGVVAAALGIFANNKSSEASAQGAAVTSVASSASVAQNEADTTIQTLQSVNSVLNSQLSARPTITVTETAQAAGTTATPTSAAKSGQVRHQGEVTLAGSGSIDLNSPADDPMWGYVATWTMRSDSANLNIGNLQLWAVQSTNVAQGEVADYQTCQSKTTYANENILLASRMADTSVTCLMLVSGRFGTVRLVSQSGDQYTFEFTIWEK